MAVASGPNELARIEACLMRNHMRQQRVGCDVERHTQKCIGAALVELTREAAPRHVKLKQYMARLQLHLVEFAYVPRAYNQTARVRIAFDLLDSVTDLIDRVTVASRPRPP